MSAARPGASPDGLPPLGQVVRDLELSARKSLGQNFILDLNLTRRIARAAGPLAGKTLIEVGPGPGGLTRALFLEGAARVVAVERDERCRPALEARAGVQRAQRDQRQGLRREGHLVAADSERW
jgi:16S rRNA (adenine1518-N6/adenine1519-N6)-dimethyltransferase